MSRLMIALFVLAGPGLAGSAAAQAVVPKAASAPMSKDGYNIAKKNADAQYKIDKSACSSLRGNAKDICVAEAKGKYNVAVADAEAAYKNTPKTRENARLARVQATYDVVIERCDDRAGNRKDACVKDAKAALAKGKEDARIDRVAPDASQEEAARQAAARKAAEAARREAEFRAELERCDALTGLAKDACVSNTKLLHGKS